MTGLQHNKPGAAFSTARWVPTLTAAGAKARKLREKGAPSREGGSSPALRAQVYPRKGAGTPGTFSESAQRAYWVGVGMESGPKLALAVFAGTAGAVAGAGCAAAVPGVSVEQCAWKSALAFVS